MLIAQGLSKAYNAVPVLQNLELTLAKGQITALAGPSGSGKTTLLHLLAGLQKPDAGTINSVSTAYCFQEPRLIPWRTIEQNLQITVPNTDWPAILQAFDLAPAVLHQYPAELSGGMRHRVALARALAYPAQLYLLDEPLAGIDAALKQRCIDYLISWHQTRQATVLLVTHDLAEIRALAAQAYVLNRPPHGLTGPLTPVQFTTIPNLLLGGLDDCAND